MTGLESVEAKEKVIEEGIDGLFHKPIVLFGRNYFLFLIPYLAILSFHISYVGMEISLFWSKDLASLSLFRDADFSGRWNPDCRILF